MVNFVLGPDNPAIRLANRDARGFLLMANSLDNPGLSRPTWECLAERYPANLYDLRSVEGHAVAPMA